MKAGFIPATKHDKGRGKQREALRIKAIVQRNRR
jgi:hypothetical protein